MSAAADAVRVRPEELTPPYWVATGARAITVLAGAPGSSRWPTRRWSAATRGLIAGTSVVFWAFATWLIPPRRPPAGGDTGADQVPFPYEATLWSIIFPLGHVRRRGNYLGRADSLPLVGVIGGAELWVAFAVWALTFVGMVAHVTLLNRAPAAS